MEANIEWRTFNETTKRVGYFDNIEDNNFPNFLSNMYSYGYYNNYKLRFRSWELYMDGTADLALLSNDWDFKINRIDIKNVKLSKKVFFIPIL